MFFMTDVENVLCPKTRRNQISTRSNRGKKGNYRAEKELGEVPREANEKQLRTRSESNKSTSSTSAAQTHNSTWHPRRPCGLRRFHIDMLVVVCVCVFLFRPDQPTFCGLNATPVAFEVASAAPKPHRLRLDFSCSDIFSVQHRCCIWHATASKQT